LTKENSITYLEQAKKLLKVERPEEALPILSKAIELDPLFAEAYECRSIALTRLGRGEEADADSQMAKSIRQPKDTGSKRKRPVNIGKVDMTDIHNIYDDLTVDADDELAFDDNLYDYVFSDDELESEELLDRLVSSSEKERTGSPAILEYINGKREEVLTTYLFDPTSEEVTIEHDEASEASVLSLDQLSCIRMVRAPSGFARNKDEKCHVEIIETFDGNIYHEAIHPLQPQEQVVFGFSTKEDSRFKYTFIPTINIKKRFQRRYLGQILLDQNLLTNVALKTALDEHNELKTIKFGRVIAEQANILYSAVENEIKKAYQGSMRGRKVGEILLSAGLVNQEQIDKALAYQKRMHNRKLGHFLIEKGILQEKDVYMALAEKFCIPFVNLREIKGSKKVLSLLPRELIVKLRVLPLSVTKNTLVIATELPDPMSICDVVIKYSPVKNVDFVLVQPSHLRNVIKVLFQEKNKPEQN